MIIVGMCAHLIELGSRSGDLGVIYVLLID